jgi:RNA polymerase sigma-70 factor (ECF subfamily)
MSDDEFHDLVVRVDEGDAEAAASMVLLCRDILMPIIRRRMRAMRDAVQSQLDSVDVFQNVMKSVFRERLQGKLWAGFTAWKAYLGAMARKKTGTAIRGLLADRRDARRTESLTPLVESGGQVPADSSDHVESVTLTEVWELLTDGLPWIQCDILDLLSQGYTHREVAELAGVSEKTIQRLVEKVRHRRIR